jgi:transcriptional regulator GlxA family with amidase domain
MVRCDYGAAVAADAARLSVMPLERAGGQAQFIDHEPPAPDGASLEPLQRWLEKHLDEPLALEDIARKASMSVRTLNRRFREQTGTTPVQWLQRARARRAQHLLETSDQPIDRIAERAGFGSTATFRDRFHRVVGTSPQGYRRAFRRAVG